MLYVPWHPHYCLYISDFPWKISLHFVPWRTHYLSRGRWRQIHIQIDNIPLCKIKDVGQLLLWQLPHLHNCIWLSQFPLKLQMNKVLLCICILKGLLCCIKQLPPAAALDLAHWVKFLCAGKRHWEFFNQMHPSVFMGLWELSVSMFLQSSAIINIPTVAFLQLCSVVVNRRLVRVCLLGTVPLEWHCTQPNRFYSSHIH